MWQLWNIPTPVGLEGSGYSCDGSQGYVGGAVGAMDTFEGTQRARFGPKLCLLLELCLCEQVVM